MPFESASEVYMYYTWGYIKENALAKLNLTEEEANQQNFLSNFPYYANEAMTQICSSIMPHEEFLIVKVWKKHDAWKYYTHEFGVYCDCPEHKEMTPMPGDDMYEKKKAFWEKWHTLSFVDEPIEFPEDFISFSDDVAEYKAPPLYVQGILVDVPKFKEVGDEVIEYYGYNQVLCHCDGEYRIPYHARWFFFTKDLADADKITAPADVCDAIPSYIVSQCLKIDDEQKAAIFRNEYEIFLARIDNTSFRSQRTLHIGGGW